MSLKEDIEKLLNEDMIQLFDEFQTIEKLGDVVDKAEFNYAKGILFCRRHALSEFLRDSHSRLQERIKHIVFEEIEKYEKEFKRKNKIGDAVLTILKEIRE